MPEKTRKPLEPWQIEDAARLRALFNTHTTFSQDAFGAEYEIGTQGMVWQYLNARAPLNLAAAIKFARGLGVSVADISPTLAKELGTAGPGAGHTLDEIIRDLPANDRQLTLDFIQYRIERAAPMLAREKFARYMKMLTNIKDDRDDKRDHEDKPGTDEH